MFPGKKVEQWTEPLQAKTVQQQVRDCCRAPRTFLSTFGHFCIAGRQDLRVEVHVLETEREDQMVQGQEGGVLWR